MIPKLDDDTVARLAWRCLSGKAADLLTFERSPEFFPQCTYSVPTLQLDRFVAAIIDAVAQKLIPPITPVPTATDEMVNRFLSWRIPDSFGPDCYVTFDRDRARANNIWPVGTNIFSADEAKQMLEHVLASAPPSAGEQHA